MFINSFFSPALIVVIDGLIWFFFVLFFSLLFRSLWLCLEVQETMPLLCILHL